MESQTFEDAVKYHVENTPQDYTFNKNGVNYVDFKEAVYMKLRGAGWFFDRDRSKYLSGVVHDHTMEKWKEWKETE
ncbi:hypothetical protein [Enterovibrio calviensis]|uniref:hypothetical protein n=1 Tax=Enterovibrio calviensis TaxID=91359 RepID=UPI00047FE242|nr:hypothetical protein [Enterovibrio calviensis]